MALENAVAHGVADRIEPALGDLFDVEPSPHVPVDLRDREPAVHPERGRAYAGRRRELRAGPRARRRPRRPGPGAAPARRVAGRSRARWTGASWRSTADQAEPATAAAAERLPGWSVTVHPDLSGRPRVLSVEAPSGRRPALRRAIPTEGDVCCPRPPPGTLSADAVDRRSAA